nr:hypothetical protein [Tanacetum cinerariifolium]
MAQTDMLERFENLLVGYDALAKTHFECSKTVGKLLDARLDLEHNVKLYNSAINRYQALKEEHTGCGQKIKALVEEMNSLSVFNRDQALRIKELEAEVARRILLLRLPNGCQPRELKNARSCCLLKSHEYKKSLSEPFNMAIQAGWGKGLSEGRTDKEIMAVLHKAENFDAYFDNKLYPMYDKLFENEYPYIEKITSGYRHSVVDLLKVHQYINWCSCRNVEEGESSWSASVYIPKWAIPLRCRECKGAMAQTDMLERFENLLVGYDALAKTHFECSKTVGKLLDARLDLEHNVKLYNSAINRYQALKEEHTGCGQKIKALVEEMNSLSVFNRDQALRIKELEAEVARRILLLRL